jgi:acetoin utilization deacetylase AcuC-like enzyme
VQNQNLGAVEAPKDFGLEPIARIHSRDYLDFFKGAWARWTEFNTDGDLLPYTWPARTLRQIKPTSLHGQLGYYSFDGGAPITAGTWQAAYSAAQVALTAQAEIQAGARSAFALCRPPGHRRQRLDGRYCYLNNAAIAARPSSTRVTKRSRSSTSTTTTATAPNRFSMNATTCCSPRSTATRKRSFRSSSATTTSAAKAR